MFSLFTKQASSWVTVALLLILTGCASTPDASRFLPNTL